MYISYTHTHTAGDNCSLKALCLESRVPAMSESLAVGLSGALLEAFHVLLELFVKLWARHGAAAASPGPVRCFSLRHWPLLRRLLAQS